MRVLVGCEESGVVRDEFIALGHEALSCDLKPTRKPGPHYQGDIFDVIDYPWDLAIFHPPCTHSAVSGARHFSAKKLDGRYYSGLSFIFLLLRRSAHIPRVAIEQPVSVLSTLYRPPDQVLQPWMFGHGETKATCIWRKGLPELVATDKVEGRHPRIHLMSPGPDRAQKRSETYLGIAQAFARQWGSL